MQSIYAYIRSLGPKGEHVPFWRLLQTKYLKRLIFHSFHRIFQQQQQLFNNINLKRLSNLMASLDYKLHNLSFPLQESI